MLIITKPEVRVVVDGIGTVLHDYVHVFMVTLAVLKE